MIVAAIGLTVLLASSWIVWTVLLLVMLFVAGPASSADLDDETRRSTAPRLILAVVALVMFDLCFTPAPIRTDFRTATEPASRFSSEQSLSGSTSDDHVCRATLRHARQRALQRFAHRRAARAFQEELHAVLAAQLRQRRRRRAEHAKPAVRRRATPR